uniref:Uncharacterized protein n=1 Tax=Meloidogyne enterolobii TaxID=390850 RepID=A0A6V7V3A4_MELEN|nr:unnamed protein product [Meloidogyne enterolobii]
MTSKNNQNNFSIDNLLSSMVATPQPHFPICWPALPNPSPIQLPPCFPFAPWPPPPPAPMALIPFWPSPGNPQNFPFNHQNNGGGNSLPLSPLNSPSFDNSVTGRRHTTANSNNSNISESSPKIVNKSKNEETPPKKKLKMQQKQSNNDKITDIFNNPICPIFPVTTMGGDSANFFGFHPPPPPPLIFAPPNVSSSNGFNLINENKEKNHQKNNLNNSINDNSSPLISAPSVSSKGGGLSSPLSNSQNNSSIHRHLDNSGASSFGKEKKEVGEEIIIIVIQDVNEDIEQYLQKINF